MSQETYENPYYTATCKRPCTSASPKRPARVECHAWPRGRWWNTSVMGWVMYLERPGDCVVERHGLGRQSLSVESFLSARPLDGPTVVVVYLDVLLALWLFSNQNSMLCHSLGSCHYHGLRSSSYCMCTNLHVFDFAEAPIALLAIAVFRSCTVLSSLAKEIAQLSQGSWAFRVEPVVMPSSGSAPKYPHHSNLG